MRTVGGPAWAVRAALGVLLTAAAGCQAGATAPERPHLPTRALQAPRQATPPTSLPDPTVHQRVALGRSRAGRPIAVEHLGDPDSPHRVLIVGCVHGDEAAGVAIAKALEGARITGDVDLWVVEDLNPDGAARRVRGNAHGVDLNRNFPVGWRPLGPPGSLHYAGPRALSEPESRLAAALIDRLHPSVSIWYHQALDVVDVSEGPRHLEDLYAADTGLPERSLPDYPGSGVGYQNHRFGPSAFVVELPAGPVGPRQLNRHLTALLDVLRHA